MKKCLIFFLSFLVFGCTKDPSFFIVNVNIIDVESGNIFTKQFLEVQDGLIVGQGDMNLSFIQEDNIIDGNNMYLTPGLSDMYIHTGKQYNDLFFWGIHPGDKLIAHGITTIRDAGSFDTPLEKVHNKKTILGNETIGPNIIKSTHANYSSGNDIERLKSRIIYENADFINMFLYIPDTQMNNILTFAEENEIYTYGNIYSFNDFIRSSAKGLDELAHISSLRLFLIDNDYSKSINWFDKKDYMSKLDNYFSKFYSLSDEELVKSIEPKLLKLIDTIQNNNISITTTLAIEELWEMKVLNEESYFEYAVKNKIPKIYVKNFKQGVAGDSFRILNYPDYLIFQYRIDRLILKLLKEHKVSLVAGSNLTPIAWYGIAPGVSLHDELRILVESGFTVIEALQTATFFPSMVGKEIGLDFQFGELKVGYVADMVFTKENPLEDISVLRQPDLVMKSGVLYDNAELQQLR